MPFERGSVTFSMFELSGELPEDLLGLFAAKRPVHSIRSIRSRSSAG